MNKAVAPLAEIYKTNTNLFFGSINDISDSDMITRPNNKGNSLHWIAGHLVTCRYHVTKLIGLKEDCPWGELMDYGASIKDQSEYPPLSEIKDVWTSITDKLIKRLGELTDSELQEKVTYDFPTNDKTVLGGIAFLALHDSYHVGQIAYIRNLLDYKSLTG